MEKKKGMIFGKLNIIDLAIILVVIAGVAFFAYKFMTAGGITPPADEVSIVFFEEECPDYVPEHTHIGDSVLDGTTNTYLGTVTDIQIDESVTYTYDNITAETTLGHKEGYVSAYITTDCFGQITDNGFVVDGTLYSVGGTLILHAGQGKYYLTIYSIDTIQDN